MSFAYNPISSTGDSTVSGKPQFFRIRKTSDQTFTSSGETVTWDAEDVDEPGGVNLVASNTKIFTAPVDGILDLTLYVRWASDAETADRWLIVKRFNSSDAQQERVDNNCFRDDGATQAQYQDVQVKFEMSAGDYVTLQGFFPGTSNDFDDVGPGTLANGGNAAYARGFWWPS